MSGRRSIPRGESKGEAGTWYPGSLDGASTVFLTCPGCGRSGPLDSHTIKDDGAVEPSIACECGFHEWVQLQDYRFC